jgi:hypothetical protein
VYPLLFLVFLGVTVGVISSSIFGLGLLVVAWLFRRDEPARWRAMLARRAQNTLLGLVAAIGPIALLGLSPNPAGMRIAIWGIVILPLIGAAIMGLFFGRLNHAKPAGGPVDPEL